MDNKCGRSRKRYLSQKEIEELMALPSDSEDDMFDEDNDDYFDPDYIPAENNKHDTEAMIDEEESNIAPSTSSGITHSHNKETISKNDIDNIIHLTSKKQAIKTEFPAGLKKGRVLLVGKGHFCIPKGMFRILKGIS